MKVKLDGAGEQAWACLANKIETEDNAVAIFAAASLVGEPMESADSSIQRLAQCGLCRFLFAVTHDDTLNITQVIKPKRLIEYCVPPSPADKSA